MIRARLGLRHRKLLQRFRIMVRERLAHFLRNDTDLLAYDDHLGSSPFS